MLQFAGAAVSQDKQLYIYIQSAAFKLYQFLIWMYVVANHTSD